MLCRAVAQIWEAILTACVIPVCAAYFWWVGGFVTGVINGLAGVLAPWLVPKDPARPDPGVVSAALWDELTVNSRCAVVAVLGRIAAVADAGHLEGKYTVEVHRIKSGYDEMNGTTAPLLIFEVKPVSTAIDYDANPVICQHGVLDTCGAFMFQRTGSLLVKLLKERRCVYLTNARFSRVNETCDTPHLNAMCSSFGYMAIFDVPANINFVRRRAKAAKVSYVGHSQGTAQMFAALSLGYEDVGLHDHLNKEVYDELQKALVHVDKFVALAPVTRLSHFVGHGAGLCTTFNPWTPAAPFWPRDGRSFHATVFLWKAAVTMVYWLCRVVLLVVAGCRTARVLRALGFQAILTGGMKPLLGFGRLVLGIMPRLLVPIASVLTGWNPHSTIAPEDIADCVGLTTPGGATTLDFTQWSRCVSAHWTQVTAGGRRRRTGGFFQPNSTREYSLPNVTYQHSDHLKHIALFFGTYDRLGNPRDVADLRHALDSGLRDAVHSGRALAAGDAAHVVRCVPFNYAHLDFVWSRDATQDGGLNDQVVALV